MYYQTEVYWPVTDKWASVSEIVPIGDDFQFTPSKRLTLDEAEIEIQRLKAMYRNLEFQIKPFREQHNG